MRALRDLQSLPDDALVSNDEAAALLGVDGDTTRRWDKLGVAGWPPLLKLGPRISRRRLGDVRRFVVQSHRTAA